MKKYLYIIITIIFLVIVFFILQNDRSVKDLSKVDCSFNLSDVSCEDLIERENVEKYLWENIKTLSPVPAVLGGSWYVVSADIDLVKNSGTVIYEDGHIQEEREFTYEISELGEVVNLIIK